MSLYDDDMVTDKAAAPGWASGIKMMHNQLAFKKATTSTNKRDQYRRKPDKLPPVIDLKSRKEEEENTPPYIVYGESPRTSTVDSAELEWKFVNEYQPHWPNEYEKVVKEMKERKEREEEERRREDREMRDRSRRESFKPEESGFSRPRPMDDEDEERERPRRGGGAAIAPPPSLDEGSVQIPMPQKPSTSYGGIGGSVAAKIMAKYGFKEGQGLGKSQQGIVKALEVEKTSKRGGRIVTEGEGSPPPPSHSMMPPPPPLVPKERPERKIVDILKNPSRVALLFNMIGPGEVDDELEPEVREECSSKYGPVIQVVIFEIPKAEDDEAVRIYVEFERVESAIKAVIDLNGRFFGGRQVRAGFYDYDNFKAYKLNEPA